MSSPPPPDLNSLAQEALDVWQEHLAKLASDPKAKADLAAWMEPSRRMFAEWMEKSQSAAHGSAAFAPFTPPAAPGPASRPAPAGPASDDGALRFAQLALHVAGLEKRVAALEAAAARKPRSARKTSGTSEG